VGHDALEYESQELSAFGNRGSIIPQHDEKASKLAKFRLCLGQEMLPHWVLCSHFVAK
jgi:hypothetical protein